MRRTFRLFSLALVCCASLFFARQINRRIVAARPLALSAPISAPARLADSRDAASSTVPATLSAMRTPASAPTTTKKTAARNLVRDALLPDALSFEPAAKNATGVQFAAHSREMSVALAADGIHVAVKPQGSATAPADTDTLSIHVRGSQAFDWQGKDKLPGETNYFIGNDPKRWRTHVSQYSRVETSDTQPVSMAVYHTADAKSSSQSKIAQAFEYDIRTASAVDPAKLRLELQGAKNLKIDREGDLVMRVGGRELRMNRPAIYEQVSATTTTGTRKQSTSTTRKKSTTSTHRAPRGARRETTPRKTQSRSANAQRSRLRKSMHDDPPTRKKRRPTKPLPKLPLETAPPPKKTAPKQPKAPPSNGQQSRRPIHGGYMLEADGSVGFWLGKHDPRAALVIDPSLTLNYETFLGGTGADSVTSMTADSSGNVYLGGTTTSAATFPEVANDDFGGTHGSTQLFIAKIAFASGTGTLQYLSFFGGSATQAGGQVAVDPSGNAAILGVTTSIDYPVTDSSTPTTGLTTNKGNDIIVSEVDPTGTNLIFSTLFGGSGSESQNAATGVALTSSLDIPAAEGGIAFDASGNIYIASDTTSTDLPVTPNPGAYVTTFGRSDGSQKSDGFLAEFKPQNVGTGTSDLIYCTYLGTNTDGAVAIGGVAVDAVNASDLNAIPNVYIAGLSDNQYDGFPVTNAVQSSYGGGASDAFLMKISPEGGGTADLTYATLLGGVCADEAFGVAVDTQVPANAYVVGATQSPSFPASTVAGALLGPSTTLNQPTQPQCVSSGTQNAFLAVLAQNAAKQTTSLLYFTYLGGTLQDAAQSVALVPPQSADQFCQLAGQCVVIGGTTTSYNFGWHDNVQAFNGYADAFAAEINTTKSGSSSLLYATPLGGSFQTPGSAVSTLGNAVAADSQGDIYVAGATTASNFPTAITSNRQMNGFQNICGSCGETPALPDAFLAALQASAPAQPAVSFNLPHLSFGSGDPIPVGTPAISQSIEFVNTGDSALHLDPNLATPVSITGVNALDFSVSPGSSCPQAIQPGQGCILSIGFTPSLAGTEGASLSVADDAPGSPQIFELTGVGTGLIQVSPAGLEFGSVAVGSESSAIAVQIIPDSEAQITAVSLIADSGPNDFYPDSLGSGIQCPQEPGQKCAVAYWFRPSAIGPSTAEIDVYYTQQGVAQPELKIPMSGNGATAAPLAVVTPAAINFGSQPAGGNGVSRTISIANTGSAPLGFTQGITVAGANAADFSASGCSSAVAPASSCTVKVTFAPQSSGSKTATLTISDNATGSPQSVALSGIAPTSSQVQVLPTSWGFAPESLGTQSAPEAITITNVGSLPVNFTQNFAITGANASDFSETTNCSLQSALQPNAQCTVQVVFTPGAGGNRTATLTVSDSAAGSPQTVTLRGQGLQANATVSTTNINFGGQQVGTSSATQTVTLTSAGPGQPLKISCVSIVPCGSTISAGQDFTETDNCGTSPITTSCSIQVTFTPLCTAEPAVRQATLTIQDNGVTPTQTVSLTGTATGDFCLAPMSGGLSDTVSAGTMATFSPISVLSVASASGAPFSGSVNLTCSSSPAGPACTFSPSATIPVSPNVPGKFEVQAATSASSGLNRPGAGIRPSRPLLLLLEGLISLLAWLVFVRARSRWSTAFATLALIVLCVAMGSCGGNTASVASDPSTTTYTLTVSASDGTQVQTGNLQLNVTSQ